ncbi:UNVERIFIED_CONTAM: hypothetical protein FKN15_071407 [Acipenser sinensis]
MFRAKFKPSAAGRGQQAVNIRLSVMAVTLRGGRVGVRAFLLSEWLRGRGRQPVDIRLSVMAVTRRGRGRQPVDIRLSVMAVTRRGLPLENVKGVRKRWR